MVAAHSPYSSNVILSLSFLFVFSRGRRGDASETSYMAGAAFSANGGSRRIFLVAGRFAKICSLNAERTLSLGGGNWSCCWNSPADVFRAVKYFVAPLR